jgi:hypothetical protein
MSGSGGVSGGALPVSPSTDLKSSGKGITSVLQSGVMRCLSESEVHSVVIEKVRPFNDVFAGFSKMTFRLIVDGDLVAEYG